MGGYKTVEIFVHNDKIRIERMDAHTRDSLVAAFTTGKQRTVTLTFGDPDNRQMILRIDSVHRIDVIDLP